MSTTFPDAVADSSVEAGETGEAGATGKTGAATGTVDVAAALGAVTADLSPPRRSDAGAQPADSSAKANKANHAEAMAAIPIDPKSSKPEPIVPVSLEAKLVFLVSMFISWCLHRFNMKRLHGREFRRAGASGVIYKAAKKMPNFRHLFDQIQLSAPHYQRAGSAFRIVNIL